MTIQLNCIFPQGMDNAILGVSAIRNALVTCKVPIEFTAIYTDPNQKEFLKASSLFRYHVLADKDYIPGEDDLVLEPDKSQAYQFAENEARARLKKMKMIDPDLGDDPGPIFPWDRYQTLEKQCINWIGALAGKEIKYNPVLFTSPTIRIPKLYRDKANNIVKHEDIHGDFIILDLNTNLKYYEIERLLDNNIYIFDLNDEEFDIYTDMEKMGLLTHKDCIGYIGATWLAYAAWALNTPVLIQITEDSGWDGVQSKSSIVLSNKEEFEERTVKQLNQIITPRVYELV